MSEKNMVTIDGNTAVSHVAHATNEVIAIYPITPSSPMGEMSDQYSANGKKNIWGTIPHVIEMQSEGGASGAVHGALTTGALTTTFTASQGLLLMLPNMHKIAGELTPAVFHIAARALASQALSIFGDHTDVMSARSTGFGILSSSNIQEVMDFALISQAATLESRVPFLHFFDGFRSSHEIQKIQELSYDIMKEMLPAELIQAHRMRGMDPENPVIRGTSQNPDVFFAARESVNKYYEKTPAIMKKAMDKFAELTGRRYHLFDYTGAPDAERVIVLMGSAGDTCEETAEYLMDQGEKVGVLKVRLFRPFSAYHLLEALPASVNKIAVLDMTKEPGSLGEPLYEDVRTAFGEEMSKGNPKFKTYPKIIGGRYGLGLSGHGVTPAMIKSVYDNLKDQHPKNHFTIGIRDDVTNTSLEWDPNWIIEADEVHRAMFYGLGSDGTVGANKNSIKIIGKATDYNAQGYFVYDSKKAGAVTVSHLRFGPKQIKSAYLIQSADFIACHNDSFLEKYDMLSRLKDGGTFLLTSHYSKDEVWKTLPVEVQKQIIEKKAKFYVIDAVDIAEKVGLGGRINVIMQTAFFKISGILEEGEAIELIKKAVKDTYGKKGQEVVDMNIEAVDKALDRIDSVDYPSSVQGNLTMKDPVPSNAPAFVKDVIGEIIAGRGEKIPVSKLPDDGTYPTGTTKYEKRNVAEQIPVWEPGICIQCGDCSMVCPHGVIRMKAYDESYVEKAPETFKCADAKGKGFDNMKVTIQVAPEDCTGCGACINICPAHEKVNGEKTEKKAINFGRQKPLRLPEAENWDYFLSIPNTDRKLLNLKSTKGTQMIQPLFEFSGACAGCGETPYVKLMSQLFGDRAIIANATGCSSIYGGNLPTTPYSQREDGRGPVWSNSLFEDAAEFGFGMKLTTDKMTEYALELIAKELSEGTIGLDKSLLENIKNNTQDDQDAIEQQRGYVGELKKALDAKGTAEAKELYSCSDNLVKKSVWVLGGDGWAYDIGYGGLDHVLASGKNINVLVLDTEVYSNTGGQMSKATPTGAIAKFAASGKAAGKKDLGMMAMSYGYVYVAKIAMGYNRMQTIKAFQEAEAYDGPSIIIAYSHCIAQGLDMTKGMDQQKLAVNSGMWPLYRFNPDNTENGKNPLLLDSKQPSVDIEDYVYNENRFKSLLRTSPDRAKMLLDSLKKQVKRQYDNYKYLADRKYD